MFWRNVSRIHFNSTLFKSRQNRQHKRDFRLAATGGVKFSWGKGLACSWKFANTFSAPAASGKTPARRKGAHGGKQKIAVSHQACPRLFFGCRPWNSGAVKRTRTSMELPPLGPEPSASATVTPKITRIFGGPIRQWRNVSRAHFNSAFLSRGKIASASAIFVWPR